MPYHKKDGTTVYPKHMVIDEYTYRTDLSRQRKWQLRKRKQCRCVTCGDQLIPDGNGYVPEKCDTCRDNTNLNRQGLLQGRRERIAPMGTDVEGLEP